MRLLQEATAKSRFVMSLVPLLSRSLLVGLFPNQDFVICMCACARVERYVCVSVEVSVYISISTYISKVTYV